MTDAPNLAKTYTAYLDGNAVARQARDDLRAMLGGDMWLGGRSWIGDMLAPDDPEYAQFQRETEKGFTSKNVLAELRNRHMRAVVGNEPGWEWDGARDAARDELNRVTTEWWDSDERRAHMVLQQAVKDRIALSSGVLRLYIPSGKLRALAGPPKTVGGATVYTVPRIPFAAAADLVQVMVCAPGSARVIRNPDTLERIGVYRYRHEDRDWLEVHTIENDTTVLRQFQVEAPDTTLSEVRMLLGRRLLLHELHGEPLLTPQIVQLQRLYNLTLTQLGRNVNLAGGLERYFVNAQAPGTEVADPAAPGGKRFVPQPLLLGPRHTPFVMGALYEESDGKVRMANPNIQWRDPVPVTSFQDTITIVYRAMLEEAEQVHVLLDSDATASGESRKQARAAFAASLGPTEADVAAAMRWKLETVVALADHVSGNANAHAAYKVVPQVKLDLGPKLAADVQQEMAEVKDSLRSEDRFIGDNVADDVDAEKAKIDEGRARRDPVQGVALQRQQLELERERQPMVQPPQDDQGTGSFLDGLGGEA